MNRVLLKMLFVGACAGFTIPVSAQKTTDTKMYLL